MANRRGTKRLCNQIGKEGHQDTNAYCQYPYPTTKGMERLYGKIVVGGAPRRPANAPDEPYRKEKACVKDDEWNHTPRLNRLDMRTRFARKAGRGL